MSKPTKYKYNTESIIKCSNCNSIYQISSTVDSITIEVCGNCHPFYTGQDLVIDTAGRIEKFKARLTKMTNSDIKTKKVKTRKAKMTLADVESTL